MYVYTVRNAGGEKDSVGIPAAAAHRTEASLTEGEGRGTGAQGGPAAGEGATAAGVGDLTRKSRFFTLAISYCCVLQLFISLFFIS